jgi:hypothetical protein
MIRAPIVDSTSLKLSEVVELVLLIGPLQNVRLHFVEPLLQRVLTRTIGNA